MAEKQARITESWNPATGEKLGETKLHCEADLIAFIKNARQAQPAWAAIPVRERIKRILKIRDFLVDHSDRIAETISNDNGKVRIDAIATEVLPAALAMSYYCKMANRFLKPERLRTGSILTFNKRSKLYRIPYGVVGIIAPWNYPFGIPFSEVIMALLAGNAVILKTASQAQMVGKILDECIQAADLPAGIFQHINLPGQLAGDAFLDNGIDKLLFTGSVPVGKYLMKKASETLTPIVLELGGNDPMIVCEDADLDRAVAGAIWGGFSSAGQSCGGVERLYIHENIYDAFLEKLKIGVESMTVDSDNIFDNELGCMTTEKQLKFVQNHVNDAVRKGARILVQSRIPDGRYQYYPATVLTDVNHDMAIMQEETFGTVIGIMKFKTIDEVIRLANDSNLGLTGSVWSKNRSKAIRIGRQIQAGAITINDHLMSHGLAETPWGGFKESGIGRTHGRPGFDEMTQIQVVVDDWLVFSKKNLWWQPYSEKLYEGLRGAISFLYGRNIRIKWNGFRKFCKILGHMFRK